LALLRRRSNGRSAERFGRAKLIAHCGELGSKGRRGLIAEGGMRPLSVVDVGPAGHGVAGVVDAEAKPNRKALPGGRQVWGKNTLVDRSAGQATPEHLASLPSDRSVFACAGLRMPGGPLSTSVSQRTWNMLRYLP